MTVREKPQGGRERTGIILRRVSERIQEVATPGIGRWGPAWDFVADPSNEFLDAFRAWEQHDCPDTRRELQTAANRLVRAWKDASRQWEAAGRPREHHPPEEVSA